MRLSTRHTPAVFAWLCLMAIVTAPAAGASDAPAGDPAGDLTGDISADIADEIPAEPDEAYDRALKGAQTVAVAEAHRLLAQVAADLDAAETVFAQASAEADQARSAQVETRRQLQVAEQEVRRTEREIDDLVARSGVTRDALGAVARTAYKGADMAALGVVLQTQTPLELTRRYAGMRTFMRSGDTALARMAVDEADLRRAHATLDGQRRKLQERADDAASARAAKESAKQEAVAAHTALDEKSALVETALTAAEDAQLEDYRRYMQMLDESTAIEEWLSVIDYGPAFGTGNFVLPGTGAATSEYGQRLHPILGYVKHHTGLDLGRGDGSIYAADSATVVEATWNDAYGNMVIVDHSDWQGQRLTTMYAHQSSLDVSAGQRVEKGQVIGSVGSTGYSTGAHLHFEVRLDGVHTDPRPWLSDAALPG